MSTVNYSEFVSEPSVQANVSFSATEVIMGYLTFSKITPRILREVLDSTSQINQAINVSLQWLQLFKFLNPQIKEVIKQLEVDADFSLVNIETLIGSVALTSTFSADMIISKSDLGMSRYLLKYAKTDFFEDTNKESVELHASIMDGIKDTVAQLHAITNP